MATGLTENQIEVLGNFSGIDEWVRPMDVGGRNGSHHSATLAALAKRGLVDMRWRTGSGGKWSRGSKKYRLTDAGREAARQARLF